MRAQGCIFVKTDDTCSCVKDGKCVAMKSHLLHRCFIGRWYQEVHADSIVKIHELVDESIADREHKLYHVRLIG